MGTNQNNIPAPENEKVLKDILCELRAIRNNNQSWLTIDQLSGYIGLKTSTLYQYVNQNRIPFRKLPGSSKLIFSRQEIDEWIKNNNTPNQETPTDAKVTADQIWNNLFKKS